MVSYRKVFVPMIWYIALLWQHQIMGASLPFSFVATGNITGSSGWIHTFNNQCRRYCGPMCRTFGNIIPAGPQILMPTDITYIVKPKVALCKNYIIDPGFTNTTQFTNPMLQMMAFVIAMLMMLLMVLLHGLGKVMQILLIKQMAS